MLFGNQSQGLDDGEVRDFVKEVIRKGKVIKRFHTKEEQRLVGDRGNEIKDITAHFFAAIKQYECGEVNTFGILADHIDPKTGKISRIKVITEKHESV